jgi:hypothetical protein
MRQSIIKLFLMVSFLSGFLVTILAQVKITDGTLHTIDGNSILELESTNKGLLIPRFPLNNRNLPDPLTAPVPSGMLVYSIGGAIDDGFYYWDGLKWERVITTGTNVFQTFLKDSDDTLAKSNSIIFASNDITLTLPEVTEADTGLLIIVKHTGSFTDLVKVTGYEGAAIDNLDTIEIIPNSGITFLSRGSEWFLLDGYMHSEDILNVGSKSNFKTLSDALGFLQKHMTGSKVIRIGAETQYITETQVIDLPYPLTIQGISYGTGIIAAGPGLAGKPMFRCKSESYFKMLVFDATTLAGYGLSLGEDAIRLAGEGTYHEIKDCTFDRFYNTIVDSTDAELWLFECDVSNAQNSGILLHSALPGAKFRVSETDFINCRKGIDLSKGSSAVIQLLGGVYTNEFTTDTAIIYRPSSFSFESIVISGNSWNEVGHSIKGFDFSRTDGRDANAYIEGNTGSEDKKPHCDVNVVDNSSSFTCTLANQWYKATWTVTEYYTISWLIGNNRITYLPQKSRNVFVIIAGNLAVSSSNRVITLALAKNGVSATRYGETTLRITVANQPFQFSTVIYLEDVSQDDYFELFFSSRNNGDIITVQDINWFVNSL